VVQTFKNIHPDGRISAEAKKFLQDLWATYILSDGENEALKKIEVLIDVGGSVAYYARKRRTMNVDDIQRVQNTIENNNLKALKNLLEKKRKEKVAKLLA
jgi:histone H3/H4